MHIQTSDVLQILLSTGTVESGRVVSFDGLWLELEALGNSESNMFARCESIIAYKVLAKQDLNKEYDPVKTNRESNAPPATPKEVKARELIDKIVNPKREAVFRTEDQIANGRPQRSDVHNKVMQHVRRIDDEKEDVSNHLKRTDLGGYKKVNYERPEFKYATPSFKKRSI